MYPHERSLVQKYKDQPFVIIGVNSDVDKSSLKERIEEEKITWRSFWNGPEGTGGPISKEWNVRGWPTLYVLDQKGVIRYKSCGCDEIKLDKVLTELLEGATTEKE